MDYQSYMSTHDEKGLSVTDPSREIIQGLGLGLEKVCKISNRYGVNRKVFEAWDDAGNHRFIKLGPESAIRNAVEHWQKISEYISTPEVTGHIFNGEESVLVCDFVEGMQMTDMVLQAEEIGDFKIPSLIEERKNESLKRLYESTVRSIDVSEYECLPAQSLFRDRILGKRYTEYYGEGQKNIASFFEKPIIINGTKFDYTPTSIIESIKAKLQRPDNKHVLAHLGHGDAHHQNILIGSDRTPSLIDLEYSGATTPRMELAKPYYNDLIGTLFFFFQDSLERRLVLRDSNFTGRFFDFNIEYSGGLSGRVAIAQDKIAHFSALINADDFLTINEYLIISHLTTRNPNTYSATSQRLFLALIPALYSFDPRRPASLFDVFGRQDGQG